MGLAERRVVKEFQDKHLPKLMEELEKAAGFAVPIEVAWDQLAVEGDSRLYLEAWPEIYFKPIIEACRQISRDDIGKEALREGFKRVELRNSKDASSPGRAITFDNGTLTIDHSLSNVGDTAERAKYVVEIVEKAL